MEKPENLIDALEKPFNRPSLIARFKAAILDMLVIIFLMYLVSQLIGILNVESINIKATILLLILLYEPILVTLGGTIGHRMMGLRVRKFSSFFESSEQSNINIFFSLLRYLAKIALGWISLLLITSDRYGQAIHDK